MMTVTQIKNAAKRGAQLVSEDQVYEAREFIEIMGLDDPNDPYPPGTLFDVRLARKSDFTRQTA